jgi:biotin carboxyl carrier protein
MCYDGRRATTTRYELTSAGGSFGVEVTPEKEGYRVKLDGTDYVLRLRRGDEQNAFVIELADKPVSITLLEASTQRVEMILNGERILFQRSFADVEHAPAKMQNMAAADLILAPMPGKVVGSLVKRGDRVKLGDPLVILESMKMEIAVRSDRDAVVLEILVVDGDSVKRGQGLVRLDA